MEQPVINPPTPYLGTISGGFVAGKMVRIQGYASPVAERININFQTGGSVEPRDDVALHLSIRLLEGYIARNSFQGGIWGDEQDKGDLPIQPGQKFEVIVLSGESEYKVAVNGRHFCEFPHRLPTSSVSHLSIDGDVSLSLISYESDAPSGGSDVSAAAPPQTHAAYGPLPSAPDAYGPPSGGYGPPSGYGPPPTGQYQPPPTGQYQPPPPPGYPQEKESELGSFLETAGTVLAGAIRSGAAEKLLGSLSGGGANQQQQQQQQHQQQPPTQNYGAPQSQGQDTFGGLGSLLSSFTSQNTQSQPTQQQSQGGDMLSGLGSLLSSFSGQNNQSQSQQAPPPHQQQQPSYGPPPQSGNQDALSGLGSLLSSFAGQNAQQPQPTQQQNAASAQQGGGQDILGGLSSLLSTLSTHNAAPQQNQQPSLNPSQVGGHGSVGGLGSMGPLLSSLAGQIITPKQEEQEKH